MLLIRIITVTGLPLIGAVAWPPAAYSSHLLKPVDIARAAESHSLNVQHSCLTLHPSTTIAFQHMLHSPVDLSHPVWLSIGLRPRFPPALC